ncbi:MAG: hypothetical protein K6E99_05830, partial [Bacilli bacterium]|nr:hypothetical protein [Bacilli bacterium]
MMKLFFKFKKYLKEKGFTLVELISIIIIVAIIMLIAIPAILSAVDSSKIKTFTEYLGKSANLAQSKFAEDQMNDSENECIIYNIKTDLGLANTGSFEGWILLDVNNDNVYITLYNDDFGISAFQYNNSTLKVKDYIKRKSMFTEEELTINYLCGNSTCTSCMYNDKGENKEVNNDEFIKKNSVKLIKGYEFNQKIRMLYGQSSSEANRLNLAFSKVTGFLRSDSMPEDVTKTIISVEDSS